MAEKRVVYSGWRYVHVVYDEEGPEVKTMKYVITSRLINQCVINASMRRGGNVA